MTREQEAALSACTSLDLSIRLIIDLRDRVMAARFILQEVRDLKDPVYEGLLHRIRMELDR